MSNARHCPNCGTAMPAGSPGGHCPSCLLRIGLAVDGVMLDEEKDSLLEGSANLDSHPSANTRHIGNYELLEEIGRGGMGVVYRARQLSLNRIVAVKLVRTGEFASEREIARFRAEAEAAAHLDYPNIVSIYEVGEESGQHYFSMKLMEGGSLTSGLAARVESGPLNSPTFPGRDAALTLIPIARAVHYAHQRGILHRDLKPGNILLDSQGQPHITDFGLAKRLDSDSSLTLPGAILGTPSYIAPEQTGGNRQLTTAADIYSLGAILYELLAGRPPFVGATVMETMHKVIHEEPEAPSRLRVKDGRADQCSSSRPRGLGRAFRREQAAFNDLETICLKCLEKDPGRRYPSAGELADDLERWIQREPILARPSTVAERLGKWTRRNPVLVGSLTAVVLVTTLGLTGIVWQWREAVSARDAAQRATQEKNEQIERLWQSQAVNARYYRTSGGLGQRTKALEVIAAARTVRLSIDLRNEALAALLLPDLGTQLWWKAEQTFEHPKCYDPTLDHYLPHIDFPLGQPGRLLVRYSGNHRVAADLGEIPRQPSAATFSPDGRWLAVHLADGHLRLWEWGTGRQLPSRRVGETMWEQRGFDFSPDSRGLYYGDTNGGISHVELDSGVVRQALTSVPASVVRVSPSGKWLFAGLRKELQVWAADGSRCLVRTNLVNFPRTGVLGATWHPNDEFLVLGSESELILWHCRSGAQKPFRSGRPAYPVELRLNRMGDLLFFGDQIWDLATQEPILTVTKHLGGFTALSHDERRIALQADRIGFGVWEFHPPLGNRVFMDNPLAPAAQAHPDPSPNGRWLVSGHADGWRLWDLLTGRLVDRGGDTLIYQAGFTADGRGLVTVGRDGLRYYGLSEGAGSLPTDTITVGDAKVILPGLPPRSVLEAAPPLDPETSHRRAGRTERPEAGTLTRDARYAAQVGNGYVMVTDIAGSNQFPAIRLRQSDVELRLSQDARWLATGRHNKKWFDLWDVRTGRHFVQVTNPPFLSCQFDPRSNELIAWNGFGMVRHAPEANRELHAFAWPAGEGISGVLPGGVPKGQRTLWCSTANGQLALVDSESGHLVARLDRIGGFNANCLGLDRHGDHAYLGTIPNSIRHIDLGALHRELARLGLGWREGSADARFSSAKP